MLHPNTLAHKMRFMFIENHGLNQSYSLPETSLFFWMLKCSFSVFIVLGIYDFLASVRKPEITQSGFFLVMAVIYRSFLFQGFIRDSLKYCTYV